MTLLTRTAWGKTFGLEVPDELVAEAEERMPFGSGPAETKPERTWAVASTAHLDLVIGELELWVAEHAVGFVFVHAGCVAVDGRAIVIPGRTMSGKSALVAALVGLGATYYSDEYAAIDREGRVHPYARPLSIRSPDGMVRRTPIAELNGTAGVEPVRIGLVAQVRFDAESGWSLEELSPGQVALALIDNTVPAQTRPVEVMDHLQAATDGARGLRGTRGDAAEAAQDLLRLLRSD